MRAYPPPPYVNKTERERETKKSSEHRGEAWRENLFLRRQRSRGKRERETGREEEGERFSSGGFSGRGRRKTPCFFSFFCPLLRHPPPWARHASYKRGRRREQEEEKKPEKGRENSDPVRFVPPLSFSLPSLLAAATAAEEQQQRLLPLFLARLFTRSLAHLRTYWTVILPCMPAPWCGSQ